MTETRLPTDSLPQTGKKTWRLGAARTRQLKAEIALGELTYRQLAAKFAISHQYVKEFAVMYREEIEAIKAEITEKEKEIWAADRFQRNHERIADLAEIQEEMRLLRTKFAEIVEETDDEGQPTIPADEHWAKLVQLKQQIMRAIQEDYGQLPTRSPAHRLGLLPGVTSTTDELPGTQLVYPEWNPKIHTVNPFEIPNDWARWWGVDFGFDHPFSFGCFAEARDGTLFLTDEIHRSQTLDEDHAHEIVRITRGQRLPQALVCDHDPSGQATLVRHILALTGLPADKLRVVSAYKDRDDGIAAVRARLRSEKFYVFRNSLATPDQRLLDHGRPNGAVQEFEQYIWDVKEGDDAMDMIRYVIAQIDLIGG